MPSHEAAIAKVLPLASIRYVAFSHFEADECGALNQFLAAAPSAVPVASQVGAMVSVNAFADRPAKAMADGEVLRTGRRAFKWLDAPHVPHGHPLTEGDILGPSEAFRAPMDYYAHAPHTAAVLEKLAREKPRVLACMHGSAWRGDGAQLIRALAKTLSGRTLAVAA